MTKKTQIDQVSNIEMVHRYGVDLNNRTIYLSCEEDNEDIDYRTVLQFQKNLNILNKSGSLSTIDIYLNSPGGNFTDGIAIYDMIINSDSPVNIIAYGQCSSVASIIFQAAKKRIMSNNCEFMIHDLQISIDSDAKSIKNYLDQVKLNYELMMDIFSERCSESEYFQGKNMEHVKKILKNKVTKYRDWYLNAENALLYGFCDKVLW